ncbi:dockerin type I domain-containing protein [Planctomycetota bacterium]
MRPGLTLEELAADLLVDGSRGRAFGGGFETITVRSIRNLPAENHVDTPSCRENLLNGVLPGDANRDGVFNSQDLASVFQFAEYEDGISGNSVWTEGDWNCDGEFDSSDLIRAFESGYSRDSVAAAWIGVRLVASESSEGIGDDGDDDDIRERNRYRSL